MATPKFLINVTVLNGTEEVEYKDLRIIMSDMGRWDIVRNRNSWPSQEQAPTLWMQSVAFFALIRGGLIPADTKLDSFLDTVLAIESNDEDEVAADFPAK